MESEPAGRAPSPRTFSPRSRLSPRTPRACCAGSPGSSFRSSSRRWARTSRAFSGPRTEEEAGRSASPSIPRKKTSPPVRAVRALEAYFRRARAGGADLACASRGRERWRFSGRSSRTFSSTGCCASLRRFLWSTTSTPSWKSGGEGRSVAEEDRMKRRTAAHSARGRRRGRAPSPGGSRRDGGRSRSCSPARSRRATSRSGRSWAGRVAKVLVEEGARVAAGQPIVAVETDLIDLQIAAAAGARSRRRRRT